MCTAVFPVEWRIQAQPIHLVLVFSLAQLFCTPRQRNGVKFVPCFIFVQFWAETKHAHNKREWGMSTCKCCPVERRHVVWAFELCATSNRFLDLLRTEKVLCIPFLHTREDICDEKIRFAKNKKKINKHTLEIENKQTSPLW